MAKTIESVVAVPLALARVIASLRLPGPLSALEVTVKVLALTVSTAKDRNKNKQNLRNAKFFKSSSGISLPKIKIYCNTFDSCGIYYA